MILLECSILGTRAPSQPDSRVRIGHHKAWRHRKSQEPINHVGYSLSSWPTSTFCFFHSGACARASFFFSAWIKLASFSLPLILKIFPGTVKILEVTWHGEVPRMLQGTPSLQCGSGLVTNFSLAQLLWSQTWLFSSVMKLLWKTPLLNRNWPKPIRPRKIVHCPGLT